MLKILISMVFLLFAFSAFAKDCKYGKPCGNTCISKEKVCKVSSSKTNYASTAQAKTVRAADTTEYNQSSNSSPDTEPTYKVYEGDPAGVDNGINGIFVVTDGPLDVYEFASGNSGKIFVF
jgi:hypothetical protein